MDNRMNSSAVDTVNVGTVVKIPPNIWILQKHNWRNSKQTKTIQSVHVARAVALKDLIAVNVQQVGITRVVWPVLSVNLFQIDVWVDAMKHINVWMVTLVINVWNVQENQLLMIRKLKYFLQESVHCRC